MTLFWPLSLAGELSILEVPNRQFFKRCNTIELLLNNCFLLDCLRSMFPPCPMASAWPTPPMAGVTSLPRWSALRTLTRIPVKGTAEVPWSPTRATTSPSLVLSPGDMAVPRPMLLGSMPEWPISWDGSRARSVELLVQNLSSRWIRWSSWQQKLWWWPSFQFFSGRIIDTMLFISTQLIKCVFQDREVNLTCRLMISWLEQKAVIYLLLDFQIFVKLRLFCECFYCI